MKKIVISIFFLGLGSVFAESIDDEIQRLEKENKLLELKQRNQQLSSDLEAGKVTDNKIQKDLLKGKKVKAKDKNGFFLGVEVVLGSSNYTRYTIDLDIIQSNGNNGSVSHSSIAFDGGLLLGYQWYFGETQKHGLKLSSHLYSGVGYSVSDVKGNLEAYHTFIPIKVGFDIKYLWDFLEKKNHTLGLNVGLGYEFSYYFGEAGSVEQGEGKRIADGNWDLINQGVYPTIGLHYNYKHHQVELNYRSGGILGMQNSRDDDEKMYHYSILTQSYITLNYAYRF
ncbi:outer membrane protein [Helicobacter sp. faydin-H20]|uniref:outer membrane beta-barrel protein n=1 Tax=Helicobacter anatolicus TaxID=2905874 RepID=UPI001E370623|nr:outer membrane beta-barrel protein [Helicobacter anatolicus]MCE3036841.1 outer membrane protein [Helicobacter anatolicus]